MDVMWVLHQLGAANISPMMVRSRDTTIIEVEPAEKVSDRRIGQMTVTTSTSQWIHIREE